MTLETPVAPCSSQTRRHLARRMIARGAAAYDRRTLTRLLPLGPDEIGGDGPLVTARICRLLARALRSERTRGRAGHWTYDLNRHVGLVQALKAERARLAVETARRRVALERFPT
ncbi:hypothetical protein [Chthonobacter rhizosphaerae]|uniref:hypothetical protein n=1 Tax=Chthonobacter rhizosphaerae TaxID=2735553 RepID=UPI001FE3A6E9|nr:hypothetical protein [Chthonobacter rhizosphaerae]